MNSKKLIKAQLDIYDSQIKKYGDSPQSTHNQLLEIQNLRFERLLANINTDKNYSVHDVGCGICDMYNYLKKRKYKLIYSGTDIVPAMKKMAINKFPELEYHIRDIIQDRVEETYDYVVLSGTFNLPGDINHKEWKDFTRSMIISMFKIANKGIAFNFLSQNADFYNSKMYYESISEITSFCLKNFSRFIYVDHAYPLHEFTLTVLKPKAVKQRYTNKTFNKYYKD